MKRTKSAKAGAITITIEAGDLAQKILEILSALQPPVSKPAPQKIDRRGAKPVRPQRVERISQGYLVIEAASRSRNGIAEINDIISKALSSPAWKWTPKNPSLAVWQALSKEQKEGRIVNEKRGVWRVTGKGYKFLDARSANF